MRVRDHEREEEARGSVTFTKLTEKPQQRYGYTFLFITIDSEIKKNIARIVGNESQF